VLTLMVVSVERTSTVVVSILVDVVEVVVGEVRVAVGLIVVTVELGATVTVTMLRIALEQWRSLWPHPQHQVACDNLSTAAVRALA
jgi:hypothetical protein